MLVEKFGRGAEGVRNNRGKMRMGGKKEKCLQSFKKRFIMMFITTNNSLKELSK